MANIVLARTIVTRPNTDVAWGTKIVKMGEIDGYINQNYFDTGKFLVRGTTYSDDWLVMISATQWRSEEDRLDYIKDPIIQKKHAQLREFWKANGIKARFENTEFDRKGNVVKKTEGVLVE